MVDIIETFLHIFEFNIDKEVLIEKLIHSIDDSIHFNNLEESIKKNCLYNFLKGMLLSKLNTSSSKLDALKLLLICFKEMNDEKNDHVYKYLNLVKVMN